MNVELKNNDFFQKLKDIFIRDDKKLLKIFYGGNGDLYFSIFGTYKKEEYGFMSAEFDISHEDDVYPYFDKLYADIMSCDKSEMGTKLVFDDLVYNGSIRWYSDETYNENATLMTIDKSGNKIKIKIIENPRDPSDGFSVRICNDGSKYEPFNILFMNLYNELQGYDKQQKSKDFHL